MQNTKLTLEYDGTAYSGWQIQKNTDKTIQQILEKALTRINKKAVKIIGAGRTDAGVHAIGQVANCSINVSIPVERIPAALNSLLPTDIICLKARHVNKDFHARYDAKGKKYRYIIYNRKLPSVFRRYYVYHFIRNLDLALMRKAASFLIGTHDYSSFRSASCSAKNTIKTIKSIEIIDKEPEIWVEITGDGFLYNMVRIIIGTLIEVSLGKIKLENMKKIIKSGNRELAGFTVPAKGLTLVEVYY